MKYEVWEFSTAPDYAPSNGVVAIHVMEDLPSARNMVAEINNTYKGQPHLRYASVRNLPADAK